MNTNNAPEESTPISTHPGNGKVARLPAATRDQLGQMMLDGVPYAEIIQKIGEPAKGLAEDHISAWKTHGGYDKWLAGFHRSEAIRATREEAINLISQKAAVPVQEAGRTIAAAQLYELLLSFEPMAFAGALANKPELYIRLIGTLCRISEGEAVCAHRQIQQAVVQAKLQQKEPTDAPKVLSQDQLKEVARLIKLL